MSNINDNLNLIDIEEYKSYNNEQHLFYIYPIILLIEIQISILHNFKSILIVLEYI